MNKRVVQSRVHDEGSLQALSTSLLRTGNGSDLIVHGHNKNHHLHRFMFSARCRPSFVRDMPSLGETMHMFSASSTEKSSETSLHNSEEQKAIEDEALCHVIRFMYSGTGPFVSSPSPTSSRDANGAHKAKCMESQRSAESPAVAQVCVDLCEYLGGSMLLWSRFLRKRFGIMSSTHLTLSNTALEAQKLKSTEATKAASATGAEMNSAEEIDEVVFDLSRAFNDPHVADLKLSFGDRHFFLSKALLCNRSSYFNALLDKYHPDIDGQECQTLTLEPVGPLSDAATVEAVLRCLYSGQLDVVDDEDVEVSDAVQCQGLSRRADTLTPTPTTAPPPSRGVPVSTVFECALLLGAPCILVPAVNFCRRALDRSLTSIYTTRRPHKLNPALGSETELHEKAKTESDSGASGGGTTATLEASPPVLQIWPLAHFYHAAFFTAPRRNLRTGDDHLSEENLFDYQGELVPLLEACHDAAVAQWFAVSESDEFLTWPKEIVVSLLKSGRVDAPDDQMVERLTAWADGQTNQPMPLKSTAEAAEGEDGEDGVPSMPIAGHADEGALSLSSLEQPRDVGDDSAATETGGSKGPGDVSERVDDDASKSPAKLIVHIEKSGAFQGQEHEGVQAGDGGGRGGGGSPEQNGAGGGGGGIEPKPLPLQLSVKCLTKVTGRGVKQRVSEATRVPTSRLRLFFAAIGGAAQDHNGGGGGRGGGAGSGGAEAEIADSQSLGEQLPNQVPQAPRPHELSPVRRTILLVVRVLPPSQTAVRKGFLHVRRLGSARSQHQSSLHLSNEQKDPRAALQEKQKVAAQLLLEELLPPSTFFNARNRAHVLTSHFSDQGVPPTPWNF